MGIEQYLIQEAKKEGVENGRTEKSIDFVKTLLTETEADIEKIASLVGVSASFVEEIKASLSK